MYILVGLTHECPTEEHIHAALVNNYSPAWAEWADKEFEIWTLLEVPEDE